MIRSVLAAWLAFTIACRPVTPGTEPSAIAQGAECYALTYRPPEAAGAFPSRVALEVGRDRGRAAWLPTASDTLGIWSMFQQASSWQREAGDTVAVRFSNGFSGVVLLLAPQDSVWTGQAQWLSDVVGQNPPPTPLEARRVPC